MKLKWDSVERLYQRLEENVLLSSIRNGMVLTIPVVMTGSIALMLTSIPVAGYQQLLQNLLGGSILTFLRIIHSATLGCISLYMLLAIGYSFAVSQASSNKIVTPLVSLCSYLAFTAGPDGGLHMDVFLSTSLFFAILTGVIASWLFTLLRKKWQFYRKTYVDGEDALFEHSLSMVFPAIFVIAVFALLNRLIFWATGAESLQQLLSDFNAAFFAEIGINLASGLFFILGMHFMWFFGIHGSNILDSVARNVFEPVVSQNMQQLATGGESMEIISKTFFDAFVLFGGCGTMLCLIAAIFIADRRSNVRKLTKVAFFPALFNMNELMVFGIPVVFNPIYFIPFILSPLVLTLTSYFATAVGLVPYTIQSVEWTTPIFLSGYAATNSIAGSLLQLFNLILGTAIYLPFVKLAQKIQQNRIHVAIAQLTDLVKQGEETGEIPKLTGRDDRLGAVARSLAGDLREAISHHQLTLHYQPQIDAQGKLLGAEALLRWQRKDDISLYPPLIVTLAIETGQIDTLDGWIIEKVCADLDRITKEFPNHLCISFNVSAIQLSNPWVFDKLLSEIKKYGYSPKLLGVEVTEQAIFSVSTITAALLERVREEGIKMIIDDFGMGHSSMVHLQHNQFDIVKLDGALIHDILSNHRSRDIVSSILYLSESLHFQVLAEYVETQEQRDILEQLGCVNYQGYLFSRPISFEAFISYLNDNPTLLS